MRCEHRGTIEGAQGFNAFVNKYNMIFICALTRRSPSNHVRLEVEFDVDRTFMKPKDKADIVKLHRMAKAKGLHLNAAQISSAALLDLWRGSYFLISDYAAKDLKMGFGASLSRRHRAHSGTFCEFGVHFHYSGSKESFPEFCGVTVVNAR